MGVEKPTPETVRRYLKRIVESDVFGRSPQARRFLEFVTAHTLEGESAELKAYTIGIQALGMKSDRSAPETTARMQASRVRRLLQRYYETFGSQDEIEIQLPTGSYIPQFVLRSQSHSRSDTGSRQATLPTLVIEAVEAVSSEHTDALFCRSLTEQIVSLLVPLNDLRVTRRPPALSNQLYSFVLSVTLIRSHSSLRMNAGLRRLDDGETVWTDRYDVALSTTEPDAQQDAIATRIATQVGDPVVGAIGHACRDLLGLGPGYAALQSFYRFLRRPSEEGLRLAKSALESVMPKASGSALIHGAYSCALSIEYLRAPTHRGADLLSAEAHAGSALLDDAECALAHIARALVHYHLREKLPARRSIDQALECSGATAFTQAVAGNLLFLLGDWERGFDLVERAFSTAPHLPGYLKFASALHALHLEGDPLRALEATHLVSSTLPGWGSFLESCCLANLGRRAEARRAVARVTTLLPHLAKRPGKILGEVLFLPEVAETLLRASGDAGLLPPREPSAPQKYSIAASSKALPSEIRVGILHSLSGPMALCERNLVNAAMLAIDELNSDGGLFGRPIRGIVEDGASDPTTFQTKALKLTQQDGVNSIFGCWMSSCRKAVLPVVEGQNALLWYPLQYEGLERSRHVVYTGSCLNQQIEPAVRWAFRQGLNRVLLVGSDYVFPRTAHRLIRGLVNGGGGSVVGEYYQPLGRADFSAVAEAISLEKPDIVFNTVNGADNIALFKALSRAGVRAGTTPVLSFSLSEIELARLGGRATGHLACWSYFQSTEAAENRALVERFRGRYGEGEVLSDPAATAYAQVHLWKAVAERAQGLETQDLLLHLPGAYMHLGGEELLVRENNHVDRRAIIGRARADQQFDVIWQSNGLIAPEPWLGVDQADIFARDLVLEALRALPEMAERASVLEGQVAHHAGPSPH